MNWGYAILSGGLAGGPLAPSEATAVDTCKCYMYMAYPDGTALGASEGTLDVWRLHGATTFDHAFSPGDAAGATDASGYAYVYAPQGQEITLRIGMPNASGVTAYRQVRFTVPAETTYDVSAELNYG